MPAGTAYIHLSTEKQVSESHEKHGLGCISPQKMSILHKQNKAYFKTFSSRLSTFHP